MSPEAACVQIGCNCGAFAPYFLDFSLAPLEVFKGVKFIHMMLSLTAFTTACRCITRMGEGVLPLFSYHSFSYAAL